MNTNYPNQKRAYDGTPYTLKESLGWIWRLFVLKKSNPGNIRFLPNQTTLNMVTHEIKIGVIGDIMDLSGKVLHISPEIRDFFSDCDFLVGNLEATITDLPKHKFSNDQVHDKKILDGLKNLFPPEKTYLSVANNHTGDFSEKTFESSMEAARSEGFNLFGQRDNPFVDITNFLRIIGASNWSNKLRGFDYIANMDHVGTKFIKPDVMNIFYPHWGYELELYPRKEIIHKGSELIRSYDAIIGTHSHTPQPISSVKTDYGVTKLLAYSLGDFCFGMFSRKSFQTNILSRFYYGEIIKCSIGRTETGEWAIGDMEWSFTETEAKDSATRLVVKKNSIPYFA